MPADAFASRLDLLVGSGQISSQAKAMTTRYVSEIEREFAVQLTEERGSALVTHLAMSLTRVGSGEPEIHAPAALIDEVAEHRRELEFTRALLSRFGTDLGCVVPESEVVFMTAHLRVLTAPPGSQTS